METKSPQSKSQIHSALHRTPDISRGKMPKNLSKNVLAEMLKMPVPILPPNQETDLKEVFSAMAANIEIISEESSRSTSSEEVDVENVFPLQHEDENSTMASSLPIIPPFPYFQFAQYGIPYISRCERCRYCPNCSQPQNAYGYFYPI